MLSQKVVTSATEISESIKTYRKLLGLTAKQVSERAGISIVTYSKIEKGDLGVSFSNILSVFRAIGILDKIVLAADPYESDLGRARADLILPKRIRHKN